MTIEEFEIQLALGLLDVDDMKIRLAINPNTPKAILVRLAEDEYWLIRCRVAGNTNTPAEVLAKLSENKTSDWIIKSKVAGNTSTPKEILIKLSKNSNLFTKRAATNNLTGGNASCNDNM